MSEKIGEKWKKKNADPKNTQSNYRTKQSSKSKQKLQTCHFDGSFLYA